MVLFVSNQDSRAWPPWGLKWTSAVPSLLRSEEVAVWAVRAPVVWRVWKVRNNGLWWVPGAHYSYSMLLPIMPSLSHLIWRLTSTTLNVAFCQVVAGTWQAPASHPNQSTGRNQCNPPTIRQICGTGSSSRFFRKSKPETPSHPLVSYLLIGQRLLSSARAVPKKKRCSAMSITLEQTELRSILPSAHRSPFRFYPSSPPWLCPGLVRFGFFSFSFSIFSLFWSFFSLPLFNSLILSYIAPFDLSSSSSLSALYSILSVLSCG